MSKVRELRHSRELTQAQVALLLGVQPVTVGTWERGEAIPHQRTRRKLAKLLGVKENQLGFSSASERVKGSSSSE